MNAPRSCTRCGSPIFASAVACPSCGFPVSPSQGAVPPQQNNMQFAATALAEPSQQTAVAGPVGAAFLPPGSQVPVQPIQQAPYQPQAYPPPNAMPPPAQYPPAQAGPPFPPAPAAPGSGTAKWLGGCGVAGCLGVVVAAIVGAAILGLVLMAAGSDSSTSSNPPDPGMPAELPNHGSVRSLIKPQVGSYGLITTAPVTRYPDRLTGGMIDSIGAFYSTPAGGQLTMMALGYSSASAARTHVETVHDTLVQGYGAGNVTRQPVRNKAGVMIGELCTVTEPGGLQHVYWSNSNVLFIATANAPHAIQFHQASPY